MPFTLDALRRRFRRVPAPPGRPGRSLGVPEGGDAAQAEIAPLIGALNEVTASGQAIVAAAAATADRRRAAGREQARALIDGARADATSARARAAADARRAGTRRAEAERAAARTETRRIDVRSAEREPALVEEVIACVRRGGS